MKTDTKDKSKKTVLKFPDNFLWGAGNSAFQVEGGNIWNDWFDFYKDKNFPDNGCGGKVTDHYNKFKEDFSLAKELNLNMMRISVEWSRIEKEEGIFDQKEIEHYKEVLKDLKSKGMKSVVTLHHFTSPKWFGKKGGWTKKENVNFFVRFTEKVVYELDENVDFWITINEPTVYAANAYLIGLFPPNKINPINFIKVMNNMVLANNVSYQVLKKVTTKPIGLVHNGASLVSNNLVAKLFRPVLDYFRNYYYLDKLKNNYDFLGINYYFPILVFKNKKFKTSDMGWPIYPQGLYELIKIITKRYCVPIMVTENGIADAKDSKRASYIKEHLIWLHKAIEEKCQILGYTYWSLTDNLELVEGYWPKFGLIDIDFKTSKRKIKNSAREYARICKNNEIKIN